MHANDFHSEPVRQLTKKNHYIILFSHVGPMWPCMADYEFNEPTNTDNATDTYILTADPTVSRWALMIMNGLNNSQILFLYQSIVEFIR